MTIRMNGAEPSECFAGNFGSNLKIAFDKYDQIQEGMGSVIKSFLAKVNVISSTKVTDFIIENSRIKGIKVINKNNKEESLFYDKVIVSIPAYAASNLFKSSAPVICDYLDNIKYNPVAIMIVKYQKPVFTSDIRAMVFDKNSALSNAGAYGIQDLDLVRYTFSGKVAEDLINQNTSQSNLLKIAEKIMPTGFNIKDNKSVASVYRFFDKGLCSYSSYHHQNLEQIKNNVSATKGLFLTGDYFCGVSIEACFQSAKQTISNIK